MWDYFGKCMKGERHKEKGLLCQDRMAYRQKGSIQAAALVDGASKKDESILVYEEIVEFLAEYLVEHMEELLEQKYREANEWIRMDIFKKIREIIDKCKEKYGLEEKDCASTLMALGLDHEKKKYVSLHLGDGIIVCYDEKKENWKIFSCPDNRLYENLTWHTVSEDAFDRMKFYRGKLENISRYILMTDGMYTYPVRMEEIVELLKNDCWKRECTCLGSDDIGIIELKRPDERNKIYEEQFDVKKESDNFK